MSTTARLATALAALALAGCSGGGGVAPPATPATADVAVTAPAPSSSPTPPTREQAAAIYLKAVTPANAASQALIEAHDSEAPLATIRSRAAAAAKANRAFLDVMLSTAWPADVKADAEDVARSLAVDQTVFAALAKAKTWAVVDELWPTFSTDGASAQLVRAKLGLPPAG